VNLNAGTVMDGAAVLLNDTQKQIYNYTAQIPFLNMALHELQEMFQLDEIPITDTTSAIINVPIGYDHIAFNNGANPTLPSDLIEPDILWESIAGNSSYYQMKRVAFLPQNFPYTSRFIVYTWASQEIRFIASNQSNDVKIDYIRDLFAPVVDGNSLINVINAGSFLQFRTASLCAEFIGENKTRADSLNQDAGIAVDRSLGIGNKGKQYISTRRRPFRSTFKARG
jgi:hypothetical protein